VLIVNNILRKILPPEIFRLIFYPPNLLVIKNSAWLFFEKIVRLLIGVVVGAWVARYLGPSQYGQLAYALAYIAFFQAIVNLGFDGVIIRDLARDPKERNLLLGTAFFLRIACAILCWAVAIGVLLAANNSSEDIVWIVALVGGSLFFMPLDVIDLWFQSQTQSKKIVGVKLIAVLLSSALKVGLISFHAPLWIFAAVIMLESLILALGLILVYKRDGNQIRWRLNYSRAILLLQDSWPFMISGVAIIAYMRIDQILIKNILGDEELGLYAAVLPLVTLWQFIPIALISSLGPLVSRKKLESEEAYSNLVAFIFKLFSAIAWFTIIFTILFSSFIVHTLLGEKYAAGIPVLYIYAFTNIFINLGVAQTLWIMNENKPMMSIYKALAGAIICIVGNMVLIPIMGIKGAALVAVISQFISAVLLNIVFAPNIFKMQLMSIFFIPQTKNFFKGN
jgi:O-antigen/teichoic acid export membrane protein